MGSVIETWRTPKTSRDLGRAVELFLRDALNVPIAKAERSINGGNFLVDLEDEERLAVTIHRPDDEDESVRQTSEIRVDERGDVITRKGESEGRFRPIRSYSRPRTRRELAESLAALAREELGMSVDFLTPHDSPGPWWEMGLSGLDANIDGVSIAIPADSETEMVGITGDVERDVLETFRAKLQALPLDENERYMSFDRMPRGYSLDLLTDDEARIVGQYRSGKAAAETGVKVGPPTNAAELVQAIKVFLNAAFGIRSSIIGDGINVDLAPHGVVRLTFDKPARGRKGG